MFSSFKVGELSVSQKQVVIKLIEKKTTINDLLKTGGQFLFSTLAQNWFQSFNRASKNCASLPNIFKPNGAFKQRFISEGGRLISEIFEVSDFLKLKGLLLTVDIEKALDSVNHNFLLKVLEKLWFNIRNRALQMVVKQRATLL